MNVKWFYLLLYTIAPGTHLPSPLVFRFFISNVILSGENEKGFYLLLYSVAPETLSLLFHFYIPNLVTHVLYWNI